MSQRRKRPITSKTLLEIGRARFDYALDRNNLDVWEHTGWQIHALGLAAIHTRDEDAEILLFYASESAHAMATAIRLGRVPSGHPAQEAQRPSTAEPPKPQGPPNEQVRKGGGTREKPTVAA